jgi:phosphatidylserine/phosphatidylglycerophosphate/cardiolipin synthase-like enzyme
MSDDEVAPLLQRRSRPGDPWVRRLLALAAVLAGLLATALILPVRNVPARLILDGPDDAGNYARCAERLIGGAHERISLALFVMRREDDGPVGELCQALARAAARGVVVTVLLDAGKDALTGVEDRNRDAVEWFTSQGIRVVRDEHEVTTHAKVLVIDGRQILMGSHNWTRSALSRNRESSVLIDDPAQARAIEAWLGLGAAAPGH